MDASASSAEKVAGLLQNLHVDSHQNTRDAIQVLPNSNAGVQGGLDSSGAYMPDVSNILAGYGGIDAGMYYSSNGFPSHHGYYMGGYDYVMSDWDNYIRPANTEGLEPHIGGSFSENSPLLYHPSGFAYNPQSMYAPYPSGTLNRGDGQSYNALLGNPIAGNLYQQSALSNSSPIPFSVPTNVEAFKKSQGESSDQQLNNVASRNNNGHLGARPVYTDLVSSPYARGTSSHTRTLGSQDARAGFEGNRIGTSWAESPKVAEGQERHGSSSFSVSGQYGRPLAPLVPNVPSGQMYRPRTSVPSHARVLGRGFEPPFRKYSDSANSGRVGTTGGLESQGNGHPWYESDKGKSWSRESTILNSGSPHWDIFNEQNKGPRTVRGRNQRTNTSSAGFSRTQGPTYDLRECETLPMNKDQFNRPDFVTAHDSAKFFIIKSYSEDDIHKSVKYGMWASTVNGNKKLDLAYREAQGSAKICPLFLFFSVNASGQFCGVAEMIGPVDFNSSLDFWQQDKWSGKLPVKWQIVKDVPNSQFRHIVLENNDNKPVTNSRDTQEVPLSQGSEMLNIFKSHNLKTSILDDFLFYETRQRFMQEKKAWQQTHLQLQQTNHHGSKATDEKPNEKEMSQSTSHSSEFGRPDDHSNKPSKSPEDLNRAGKEGLSEISQSGAPVVSL